MLSISADVRAKLLRQGSTPVWLAEMHLGAIAYLRVINYANGSGDSFTLTFKYSATTVTATYTEGVQWSVGADNDETAANMAAAINSDASLNNRVSAYAFRDLLVVHGYAYSTRVQATTFVDTMSIATSDSTAWFSSVSPINRRYYFCSSKGKTASTDVFPIPELREVSGVTAEIDPMTREFTIGDVELVFDDPDYNSVARELFSRIIMKGKFVQLSLGTEDMLVGDFVPVGGYFIDEVIPQQGEIHVTCCDIPSVIRDRKFDNRGAPIPRLSQPDLGGPGGTGMNVQVEIKYGGGVISRTYVEGTDWTGDSASPNNTLIDIAAAINGDAAINPYVVALFNGGGEGAETAGLYILPWRNPSAAVVPFRNRAVEVKALSSNMNDINVKSVSGYYGSDPTEEFASARDLCTPLTSGWINIHPILAMRDLYGRAGLNSSRIDENSFVHTNYPTISHWSFSATEQHVPPAGGDLSVEDCDNSIGDAQSVDLLERLSRMVQGGVVGTEDGKLKFVRRDPTKAAVKHITPDDYDEDGVEWLETYETLCNRVTIYGTAFDTNDNNKVLLMQVSESFSLAALGAQGNSNPVEMVIEEKFLGAYADVTNLMNATVDHLDDPITVEGIEAYFPGFSGCHQEAADNGGTVATDEDLNPGEDRLATFIFWRPNNGDFEYMTGTAASADASETEINRILFANTQIGNINLVPRAVNSGVLVNELAQPLDINQNWDITLTRAALGTQPINYFGTNPLAGQRIYMADATIAKAIAEHFIDFAYGCPRCRVRMHLDHLDLQLGDVVTAEFRGYLNWLCEVDGGTKWEVVAKEPEHPFILVTFARLSWPFRPSSVLTTTYEPPTDVVGAEPSDIYVTDNDLIQVTDNDFNLVTI